MRGDGVQNCTEAEGVKKCQDFVHIFYRQPLGQSLAIMRQMPLLSVNQSNK